MLATELFTVVTQARISETQMIKTSLNRYILVAVVFAALVGSLLLLQTSICLAAICFVAVASIQFLIRCPKCNSMTGKLKGGGYFLFVPKRCWNCDYEYK
jgi:hypothetical protein